MQPKIVVIDDETGPRESLRMILKDDYQVALADGALAGLELIEQVRPDLVFLDIKMPQMEGTEVLRRIKEFDSDIEVAMITAYAALESAQHALRYGAIDYLIKPFAVDDVLEVVQRALQKRQQRTRERVLLRQLQEATKVLSQQLRELREEASVDQSTVYQGLAAAHTSIESQLSRVDQLVSIGEVAAEVAHDVDNFLSAILLQLEMLLLTLRESEQVEVKQVAETLQNIVQAAQDSAQAVERISSVGKSDPYAPSRSVAVNDILKEAVNLSMGHSPADRAPQIIWEVQELPPVTANPAALRTALMNIVINARQAIETDGEIRLRTYVDNDDVVIQISDTGVGMAPEVVEQITNPFFTTKAESGSGLGLSIARKVIDRHQGTITFDSEPGIGTTVRIVLPTGGDQATETDTGSDVPDILIVDDDDRLLTVMDTLLTTAGYQVKSANNGLAGLHEFEHYLEDTNRAPGVVVADLRMPELMGTDLAKKIKELAPQTRVILLSGYITDEAELATSPYLDAVMKKPFELSDLLDQIKGAPASPSSPR